MEGIISKVSQVQAGANEKGLEELGQILSAVEKEIKQWLHPFHSYAFQMKMARAKLQKYITMIDSATQEDVIVQEGESEALAKRRHNLERLLDALEQVNKLSAVIFPPNHPQRAHILLDMGNVNSILDRPALGKKFITQGLQILTISRGEQIAKQQLQKLFSTER